MSHILKIIVVMLCIILFADALFAQSPTDVRPAWPASLFSIFLGFGTGQYWVGSNGNLFLVGDLSCVGVIAIGAVIVYGSSRSSSSPALSGAGAGYLMIGVSAIAYSAFRLWELLDVFNAVDTARRAGSVTEFYPVVAVNPTSIELGFRIRF
jgi:hypothetical protein